MEAYAVIDVETGKPIGWGCHNDGGRFGGLDINVFSEEEYLPPMHGVLLRVVKLVPKGLVGKKLKNDEYGIVLWSRETKKPMCFITRTTFRTLKSANNAMEEIEHNVFSAYKSFKGNKS